MRILLEVKPTGAGDDRRTVESLIVEGDDRATVVASVCGGNPLAEGWRLPECEAGSSVLLYSGTLAAGLFESHPHTWMPPGRAALDRLCDSIRPTLVESGVSACFRPHCRHVLSDAPSCTRFLRDHAGEPVGIALAASALLEPSMLPAIDDHLERAFAALGPVCDMVILRDVRPDGRDLAPAPLGRGVLPLRLIRDLLAAHVPAETPLLLRPADQPAWQAG